MKLSRELKILNISELEVKEVHLDESRRLRKVIVGEGEERKVKRHPSIED